MKVSKVQVVKLQAAVIKALEAHSNQAGDESLAAASYALGLQDALAILGGCNRG